MFAKQRSAPLKGWAKVVRQITFQAGTERMRTLSSVLLPLTAARQFARDWVERNAFEGVQTPRAYLYDHEGQQIASY